MLQYIVRASGKDEILREAREALKGGCRWIEVKAPVSVTDDELKETLGLLKPEVDEAGGCLTVASRVTLAKLTEIDGVQLYEGDMPATAARMELEAGPIIGMSVTSRDEVERNMRFDVDYFRFEPLFGKDSGGLDAMASVAALLRETRSDKPLACAGGITPDNMKDALAAGAEGIAVDSSIAADGRPLSDAVAEFVDAIAKMKA